MKYVFLFVMICTITISKGQYKEPKFGKIEMSELSMGRYEKDTTAEALILFDNGSVSFIINPLGKFQYVYKRHFRIKIFNNSASELGNFIITLHDEGTETEELSELKGATYNLVDGIIAETELKKENIFSEKSDEIAEKKIAFPNIKEGSIIELSFTITSDFLYKLRGWQFQYDYPAVWSQFNFIIPEYYAYRQFVKGYLAFDVNKSENTAVTLQYNQEPSGYGNIRQSAGVFILRPNAIETTLAVKDVPAFISEPDIDCDDNYIQAINFELSSIQYPKQEKQEYSQTWESVNKMMNDDEDFGKLLKSDGFIEDTVTLICSNLPSDNEKAIAIYRYVQERMKWNGEFQVYSPNGLKKSYLKRSGTSSEINLLLTLMLQNAGLKANPVLISTRDNGLVTNLYPSVTHYNSVIAKVNIDDKIFLLDATSGFCPFGILPSIDINEQGRAVDNFMGEWVDLKPNEKFRETKSIVLSINADGTFTGTITELYDGYGAIAYRNRISQANNTDDYFRIIQENLKGLTIKNYSITNLSDINKPVTDTLQVEITDHAEILGDKIIFQPLLFERIEKNHYTLEDRKYPVNYNYPISEMYVFEYTIPPGYEIESLPQSVILKLPDKSISVTYAIQQTDHKISLAYKRNINKIIFLPEEYKDLKEMYDQIVKKHAEMVILKKIGQ